MPDRPLIVTGDPLLLDDLLRLAAAAGVETAVAPDVVAARGPWRDAALVLVGGDLVADLVRIGLPRRRGVLVVPADRHQADVWTLAAAAGAESVAPLPGAEGLLVDRLAGAGAQPAGTVVVVMGGRGGAGASTLACALARAAAGSAARSAPVLLVDADPLGGGLDLLLGAESAPGLRWPDLADARGRASPRELHAALPMVDGVSLLSWHRGDPVALPGAAMDFVLGAGRRGHEVVVVDVPRSLDDAAAVAVSAADVVLVVVPADVRSVAAARQAVKRLSGTVADVRVVVRGPSPSGLTGPLVAGELGLPLAGWLPSEHGLRESVERGEPPGRSGRGPLARFCRDLLVDLATGAPTGRVA